VVPAWNKDLKMKSKSLGRFDVLSDVASPLDLSGVDSLSNAFLRLVVEGELTDNDCSDLARLSARYEKVSVVLSFGYAPTSLEFLTRFPRIDEFSLLSSSFVAFDQLQHLPEHLQRLVIGGTKKKLPLGFLARFPVLESLSLTKQLSELEVLQEMGSLASLHLYQMTLPDPFILRSLPKLKHVIVRHGGTSDLSVLGELGAIETVELWKIRGLDDLDWLGDLVNLRKLELGALRNVQRLPSLRRLKQLNYVKLDQMKGINEIAEVAAAKSLAQLHLAGMNHLPVEAYECLASHHALKALTPGYSSKKKTRSVEELLGLPRVIYEPYAHMNEF
jgi:hypothetical protein